MIQRFTNLGQKRPADTQTGLSEKAETRKKGGLGIFRHGRVGVERRFN